MPFLTDAYSPTLVANLWDVTDKDIDKLCQAVLNKMSLNGPDIAKQSGKSIRQPVSLVSAVAQSRDCCKLKYLTGAAPVVYGVPFYLWSHHLSILLYFLRRSHRYLDSRNQLQTLHQIMWSQGYPFFIFWFFKVQCHDWRSLPLSQCLRYQTNIKVFAAWPCSWHRICLKQGVYFICKLATNNRWIPRETTSRFVLNNWKCVVVLIQFLTLEDGKEECKPNQCRPSLPNALFHIASSIQWQPTLTESRLEQCASPLLDPFSCSLPYSVVFPLSPVVCNILGITDNCGLDLSTIVIRRVLLGVPIWEGPLRGVFQVGENVVVKISQDLDEDEHQVLQFLEKRLPTIPTPRALGLITIASTSFMFMTMIPGVTLEKRWPSLSTEAKMHIRCVLAETLAGLREFELPQGAPFGSPVGRRLSKDVRRHERISVDPIYSEAEFNDFLLSSPSSRAAPGYKNWLRSLLRVDHRIVFSHADFHPRNIMVVDGPDGVIELSGILDWEASGFYPEYWEQLKAMNTRSIRDTSDWWEYLPTSILGYDNDVVLDRLIESTVVHWSVELLFNARSFSNM